MSDPQGRLSVGIIGMGTAGPVIGSALRALGHQIVGVSAHSAEAIDRADTLLPGVPILPVEEVVEACELLVLAVPDAEIAGLVSGLADRGAWRMGQLLVHLAGPYGTGILAPAQAEGVIPLAIHPLLRLSGWSADVQRLVGAPFLVTAPAPFLPIAQALVVEMGGEPVVVNEDARAAVHAALTLAVAGIVVSVVECVNALKTVGVEDAPILLSRLLADAVASALTEGDTAVGTPFTVADSACVREHALALGNRDSRAHGAYMSRAREAIDLLAERGRVKERGADAMRAALLDIDGNEK